MFSCPSCHTPIAFRSGPACPNCGAVLPKPRGLPVWLIVVLALAGVVLIGVAAVAVITVPKFNRARLQAQEMGAITVIRSLQTAQTQYFSQFGRYAEDLGKLGPPPGADLIPADLASGVKNGYRFTVEGRKDGFAIRAAPVQQHRTGERTFYSDETFVIREHPGPEAATATDPEIH